MNKIFAAALRLSEMEVSLETLERRLGVPVELSQSRKPYPVIGIEHGESDDWREINAQLEKIGPAIKALLNDGDLSSAVLDVAYDFSGDVMAISRTIPARSAFLAGQYGIDLMISVYAASSE